MSSTPITLADLTSGTTTGSGVFDTLMKANKAHLEQEFNANRITGADYAKAYLAMVESTMQGSISFLVERDQISLKADLLAAQVVNAGAQKDLLIAQTATEVQQKLNLTSQKLQIEAQTELIAQQEANALLEAANIPKQGLLIDAQKSEVTQRTTNLVAEALNIPKQGALIDAQKDLALQNKLNAVTENTVLVAQECKLRAEYDLTMASVTKTGKESDLLTQKMLTEKAQITELGVDDNSLIGKQKKLYQAQTDGFARDSEQKAVKIMIDTWNARRMTDDATSANTTNKLDDATIGLFVTKMKTGINA